MNPKSKKPRKQRAFIHSLSLHLAQKRLSIHASKALREETKKRSWPAKKQDTVLVLRGEHAGKGGKITKVDYKTGRVFVEKIVRKKTDGKEILVPLHASNLLLTELNKEDQARFGKKPAKEKKIIQQAESENTKPQPARSETKVPKAKPKKRSEK